jgi:hypothetical protein
VSSALKKSPSDDLVPEVLEKKRKMQLNESTYYSTRGTHNKLNDELALNSSTYSNLRDNVRTILGVKGDS